jgi:hypothetical protein
MFNRFLNYAVSEPDAEVTIESGNYFPGLGNLTISQFGNIERYVTTLATCSLIQPFMRFLAHPIKPERPIIRWSTF